MPIESVSFGQRPYGYDPKKGAFTPEQAKKDFRPGIYDPAAQERAARRKKKIVKGIATATVIGGSILGIALFLTKGKGIEKIKNLVKGSKVETWGKAAAEKMSKINTAAQDKFKNLMQAVLKWSASHKKVIHK